MPRTLLPVLLLWLGSFAVTAASQSEPESARIVIVTAQQKIDAGELEQAITYLDEVIALYPDNDLILALYGQALYENKQIEKAEKVFMQALKINPLNTVAKSYIEVIRETSAASISEQLQQLEEVTWDKVGDLVVMALAFALGGVLGNVIKRLSIYRFERKSKELFLRGYYEDFSDMLEIQLSTNELRPLRKSLSFMLKHKSLEAAIDILRLHVNTEDNLSTLTRMLKMSQLNFEKVREADGKD